LSGGVALLACLQPLSRFCPPAPVGLLLASIRYWIWAARQVIR